MDRPGLLGKLDDRMERIRETCEVEGASLDQFATWMTSAMAEVIRDARIVEFYESRDWLKRRDAERRP